MSIAYVFIGQSGAGKGTQAALLKERLNTIDPASTPFYVETGAQFRAFIQSSGATAAKTKEMIVEGKLPPSFLGVHMWAKELIEHYDGTRAVVFDGTPRTPAEVPLLFSAAVFYGWDIHVINIAVGDEWAYEKTKGRGRDDDKDEKDIWGRIQWFHESVQPAIELLRQNKHVTFHTISGEQTIEAVHADICHSLGIFNDNH